jgi:hypothetical protein
MRMLIIGGYGTFGGRTVELLECEPALTLIVAGRSLEKAQAFCAQRPGARATLEPVHFDRQSDVAPQFAALRPDIVLDASGPFQAYGADAYQVVEAAIEARVHYLDLADGADFVSGVGAYDTRARAAGIYILSGVSSFPVLTAAVVRHLSEGMSRLDEVAGGIAPSPFAGVGENVIRAIASYAGQPVAYLGRTAKIIGRPFTQQRRYTVAPPGRLPLRNTLFSLVDVPDARALSGLWPELRRVWMGAGPVPEILHRALIALAWAIQFGVVRSATPLAPLMHWATNHLRWGEHRGGMFIELKGASADGRPETRSWHLLAEGADGPLIPSMAVQAIVRKHLAGAPPRAGARACVDDIELCDYEKLFANRTIYTGARGSPRPSAHLYERLLGGAWNALPEPIRRLHAGVIEAKGRARVERGRSPLAWLAATTFGFPPANAETPVSVRFAHDAGTEVWSRTFGDYTFSSCQYEGTGRHERLLVERFGVFEFAMALVLDDGVLRLVVRGWRFLGIALPLWLAPRSVAHETAKHGVFHFFVEISHPLCGLIVRYQGWLEGATEPTA